MFGWGDRKWWGNGKRGDRKGLVSPHVCLGGCKSGEIKNSFCFVEKKNEMIENVVCINLLSCPFTRPYYMYK